MVCEHSDGAENHHKLSFLGFRCQMRSASTRNAAALKQHLGFVASSVDHVDSGPAYVRTMRSGSICVSNWLALFRF